MLIRLRSMVHLLAGPMNGTIMLMIEMTTLLMRLLVIITPVSNQPWPLILNKKDTNFVYVVTAVYKSCVFSLCSVSSELRPVVSKSLNLPSSLNITALEQHFFFA